jgi:hypothetical protein
MENQASTVREVAALSDFSQQTVARMLERERGVLIFVRPETMHKRRSQHPHRYARVFER